MNERLEEKRLKWYQKVLLEILWGSCCLFARMPYWFRYQFVMPQIVALLRLIGYRRKVVMENLSRSFPEKSEAELHTIRRGFYRSLAEGVINTISLAGTDCRHSGDWVHWSNAESHKREVEGRDWVAMASHYPCWEFYPLWCWEENERDFFCVYHPLHNPLFECFYRRLRNYSPDVKQVPMRHTVRDFVRQRMEGGNRIALGLISDQNPTIHRNNHWFRFLNQDSLFFDGAERIALKFQIPVYFVHVRRIKPGRYEIWFEQIYDGEEEVAPNVITGRYVELLEQMIRRSPELWMWSHRRWKHKRKEQPSEE